MQEAPPRRSCEALQEEAMKKLALAIAAAALLALPAQASAVATADISITNSDSPDPVAAGGQVTYTLTVFNFGPSDATNVTVFDNLGGGTAHTGMESAPAGWAGPTDAIGIPQVRYSAANFPANTGALLTVIAGPAPTGPFSNTATMDSDTIDPNHTNNDATATTNQLVPAASMALTPVAATTPTRKCKKRRAAAAKKRRCKKKR